MASLYIFTLNKERILQ